jgi:mono/diheme cytochrome c family protein
MPVWQDLLSEEEIWQVVDFIYQGSGSGARVQEEHH